MHPDPEVIRLIGGSSGDTGISTRDGNGDGYGYGDGDGNGYGDGYGDG